MAQKRITDLEPAIALTGEELIELSQRSDTVTIEATTISAAASDNSFNDSANGFVTAGFEVGNRVAVSGFGTAANNLIVGIVTAIAAGKLTIGGTDGDAIVDEAAGASVVISKWLSVRTTAQAIVDLAGGGGSSLPVVQTEAGAYTVAPGDVGNYIRLTSGTAKAVTIETDATTALPDNGEWHFRNVGAGNATISPAGGVTVNPPSGGSLVVPTGGTVTLKRAAANVFDLLGQTVTP